ncbi:MAG: DUF5916 domain-containing protein [Acidobacteriota bacterium]|nr:DUF5916 domain-containing protein [Acidobacteriota bacterium]
MRQLATGFLMVVMYPLVLLVANAQGAENPRNQPAGVAVDIFTNVTGDPADAWIGQGFAETLTADLGGVVMGGFPRWRVVGAYQRVGRELRITSQLVDSASGQVVASVRLDGNESEIFRLQDELGRRLADQLGGVAPLPDETSVAVAAISGLEGDPPVGLPTASLLSGVRAESGAVVIDGPPPPPPPEVVARDSQGRMTIRAIRLGEPLQLDGLLQESVYSDVPAVTDFIQQEPSEGAPATDQTEVWVTFDDETLYVSARCWSEAPDQIVANEMKRDGYGMFGNDTFSVVLDTFYDRRSAFGFMTNPVGGLFDLLIANERLSNMDWNTVWNVATTRFDQGWIVEMAIPFRSLRYRSGDSQVWGIGIQRSVAAKNERSYLTPIPRSLGFDGLTRVSAAAALVDVEVPASGVRIELKPYAISDVTTNVNAAPPVLNQLAGQVGFDMKYGLTPGLTADFTYNTDFAQVEVDEQQVNLTRFSLFYPEKREFFLEGQGVFDFGAGFRDDYKTFYFGGGQFAGTAPIMFFSRRIGLQGGGTVPIQAGGRLTGKAGPYSIGLLNVQTGREREAGVASTNFSAVRMRRDILRRSSVGALFTGRSVSLDGQGSNETFGVDGVFSFYDNVKINAYLARTRTAGINHDDSSHQVQFNYNGDRWGVVAERLAVGANFNPEVGFVPRDDFKRNYAEFRFSPRPLGIDTVRKFMFEGNLDYTTDGAGTLATRLQQGLFGIEFANGDWFFAGITDNYEWLKNPFDITPEITIPLGDYSFVNARVVYALGMQRVVSGGVTVDHGGFFGGERTGLGYTFGRVNLSPQLSVEPSLSFNRIDLPQGDFSTELVSVRTTYTLTPRMFVAGLVQYNSTFDSLGTNLRFRWEYQPGSELFVVYTDERDTLNPRWSFVENRAFVVKATRLFRF